MLAGSAMDPDEDDGYLFIVFKPDLLVPLDEFKRDVSALIDRIKSVPRQPGVDEIRIPGERAFRSRERLLREGIEIDRLVYDALAALQRLNRRQVRRRRSIRTGPGAWLFAPRSRRRAGDGRQIVSRQSDHRQPGPQPRGTACRPDAARRPHGGAATPKTGAR